MRSEVVLSARMEALTRMVSRGNRVCDVGCDHGWVSIYLVQQGISPHVLAMDVRQGPLSRAQEHIRQQGLEAYIETRLSDGVAALKVGEADTMICAGMGGRLMQRILEEGREKLTAMRELILQPQSEIAAFRAYLRRAGYVTVSEDMVYEDGKYYPMMKVAPGERMAGGEAFTGHQENRRENTFRGREGTGTLEDVDGQRLGDCFGRMLLTSRHPVLKQYLLAVRENCLLCTSRAHET
ncbi:MAG: class I SAM-dependent methyltransferase, partial [Acetatifactor sp.]|nr:class I SAM-dependent methyltransferase [Acetatifactor sp.]